MSLIVSHDRHQRGFPVTPDQMDAIFQRHCDAEAAHDLEGVLGTYADAIEHDLVGDPTGVLHDRELIGKRYAEMVFAAGSDDGMKTLHRYHGDDFLVDDALITMTITGDFMGVPGNGRTITFRILHVCEFRDGAISRENVWLDGGSAIAQLTAPA
jgi:hypothetical protein